MQTPDPTQDCDTHASGSCATVEGCGTAATGSCSHAEGDHTVAAGYGSHTEGNTTTATGKYAHAEGDSTVVQGIGAHTEGNRTIVRGDYAHAEGDSTTALGVSAHSEGSATIAGPANYSHAEGNSTIANGTGAHAEGIRTTASGSYSHSEGNATTARNDYAHAEGYSTTASGFDAHSEGYSTTASGSYSHTEGYSTTASGYGSHAEGYATTARYDFAHAEGYSTMVSGYVAHAEGYSTTASGSYSHAEGYSTTASGTYSHAEGVFTSTSDHAGSHIIGRYGAADADYSWYVANGTSIANPGLAAKLIGSTGNMYIDGTYGGPAADYAELFETKDGQPMEPGCFVTLVGKKIRLAQSPDAFILGITSATPAFLGNVGELRWNKKYITDEWGRIQYHEMRVPAVTDAQGSVLIPEQTEKQPRLHSAWNPSVEYRPQIGRPEWVAVGLLGQMRVRDDGSCQVDEYCRPNDAGIATKAPQGYRVMERLGPNQILILFR